MPKRIYRKRGKDGKPAGPWYLRVQVEGRERRESLRTTDRALAERRAARRLEELSRQRWGDERHRWHEAVVAWADDHGGLRPSTVRRYLTSIAAIGDILEPLHLDEITKATMARIASRPGVTNATRRRDLQAVRTVLHKAEALGWIEAVPHYSTKNIPERRDPIVLPQPEELARFYAVLPDTLRRLCRVLELTGLRLEEAAGLEWSQVDLRRGVLTLTKTKTRRVRTVPLSPEAAGTFSGTPRHVGTPYVFWHSQEQPRRYSDPSGLLYDYRKRAGVPWRTHDLRHLFAVRYLQSGGSIYDLQQILGHSTIKTTEMYLDYLTPEEAAAAKRIGA